MIEVSIPTQVSRIESYDAYLGKRSSTYERRCARYSVAAEPLVLLDTDTLVDIGAGWTEFDAYLRTVLHWRGRYQPLDAALDGIDVEQWLPKRSYDWMVAIELVEHLYKPLEFLRRIEPMTNKGIVLTTPNPVCTDVLGMDEDHKTPVSIEDLHSLGYTVRTKNIFTPQAPDTIVAWKYRKGDPQ